MKQSATNEKEIIKYVRYLKSRMSSHPKIMVQALSNEKPVLSDSDTEHMNLPGQHVIGNILGYAKALEVLQSNHGKPILIVSN